MSTTPDLFEAIISASYRYDDASNGLLAAAHLHHLASADREQPSETPVATTQLAVTIAAERIEHYSHLVDTARSEAMYLVLGSTEAQIEAARARLAGRRRDLAMLDRALGDAATL